MGEDALKRDAVMKRLRARLSAMGDLSFNDDSFDGETAEGADIVGACDTVPFASPVRLVEVRAADKLKKADAERLVSYLGAPNGSTVLALVAEKLAKNTRLYKAVPPMARRPSSTAPRSSATSCRRRCGPWPWATASRSRRGQRAHWWTWWREHRPPGQRAQEDRAAHRGTDAVNEHEIMGLVARTAEVKPWEFVDALAARDARKCLLLLGRMESVSPHALIAKCTSRLRELVCARALCDRGAQGAIAATLKMPDWQCKNHARWARGFTAEELRRALVGARDTERAMKSGSDPDAAFLDWVLAVVPRR